MQTATECPGLALRPSMPSRRVRRGASRRNAAGGAMSGARAASHRERLLARREAARDEDAIRTLAGFIRRFWHICEPARKLVWNWHYDIICDELEAVARGETRELVICVPPGTGKSIIVSAMFQSWLWLRRPAERVLSTSANPRPIVRDSIRLRNIINSPEYVRLLALIEKRTGQPAWGMSRDQNEKVNFANSRTGTRLCSTIHGAVTGDRVDGLLVDDAYDAKAAGIGTPIQVADRMNEVVTIYDDVLASRIDPVNGWRIVIMQRLHEADLAGELIRRGVRCVVLPMEFDPTLKHRHPRDPRTMDGELLFPKRYTREWCETEKAKPGGARKWAAQYQQNPTPAMGSLFQRDWTLQRYTGDPQRFARGLRELAITIDCTFKDGRKSDYVAMQVWGRDGVKKYLLDSVRARMDLPATIQALLDLAAKWPQARLKLVEDAANGPGVIAMLRKHLPGLVGVTPMGGKYARAQTAAIAYEAGEVWLPQAEHAPWVGEYVEELCAFPNGGNDDQVDATSQLFIRWDGPEGTDAIQRTLSQWGFLTGKK